MSKNIGFKNILNKKTRDYTFIISFFAIFSFFVFFIIRPNVITVFGLQKDLNDLKILDKKYESAIVNIISIQSIYEKDRDEFPLLDQAIPPAPEVNQVVDDINKAASDAGVPLNKVEIVQVALKQKKNNEELKNYAVNVDTNSDFSSVSKFVSKMIMQRRLKIFNNLNIAREDKESSTSSSLKIKFEIGSYFL